MKFKSMATSRIAESGFVAIIRAGSSNQAVRIAEACLEGGAAIIEITFTVPNAATVIEDLSKLKGLECIGAGTVLNADTARVAIRSGAQFVVSPALIDEVAEACKLAGVPYLPGAGTVREVMNAIEAGAEIVKIFPGEVLGPAFAQAVNSVLPDTALMPTGGVNLGNVRAWIAAGCVAVGAGGNLTEPALRGDFQAITERTKRFINEVRQARS